MIFSPTPLSGAYVIELERLEDDRGFFARSFCEREFEALGLAARFVQCNVSFNRTKGTLRGMHYQAGPHTEAKVVRCTRGAVWDVIVDLRPESKTFSHWHAVELNEDNRLGLYVPEGFAHGFQTLADASELLYLMSTFFRAEEARGVRWDDPEIGIAWPLPNPVISERDRSLPLMDR